MSIVKPFLIFMGFVLIFLASPPALAKSLQFDIADDYVEITTGFTGTTLSMIGHRHGAGDIVMILEGPARSTVVRRKSQVLGAWLNRDSLRFENVPSYYDFAMSVDDASSLMGDKKLKDHHIGLEALRHSPEGDEQDSERVKSFQDALLRYKQSHELFPKKAGTIEFLSDDFFRVDFHLPAHVPAGDYIVRAFLISGGKVVVEDTQSLRVGLTGFSSQIYEFSHERGFFYGLVCVLIACFAGWLSNVIVRRN
ncbi:MAG: TIGR02186 family protein [Rhodospirillales bacterium]|nr:TIGR02186 family protein [Rhodospirillales bacterium]